MSRVSSTFALILILCLAFSACSARKASVPLGTIPAPRSPSIEEEKYGHEVLKKLSEKYTLDYQDPRLDDIRDIVEKLAKAAKADKDPWHVFLFQAPEVKMLQPQEGITSLSGVECWTS